MSSHSFLIHSGPASTAWPLLIFPPFTLHWLLLNIKTQLSKRAALKSMPLYTKCPSPVPSSSAPPLNNNLRTICPAEALLPSPSLSLFVQCSVMSASTTPRNCLGEGHPWDLKANKCISISISFYISFSLLQCLKYSQRSILFSLCNLTHLTPRAPAIDYLESRIQPTTSHTSTASLLVQASIYSCLETAVAS